MSDTPPEDPWGTPGPGSQYPPPPPPGGGYGYPPPPPPGQGYGYPPPPPPYGPPGAYPPGGGYDYSSNYGRGPGTKGWTPFGMATGWWRRVGATLVDFLVLIVPEVIIEIVAGRVAGGILAALLQAAYLTILLSQNGQTVGNRAVGTKVVSIEDGIKPSVGRALARWAPEGIIGLIILVVPVAGILGLFVVVDVLWPLWDQKNQTLHDKIAGTLVLESP